MQRDHNINRRLRRGIEKDFRSAQYFAFRSEHADKKIRRSLFRAPYLIGRVEKLIAAAFIGPCFTEEALTAHTPFESFYDDARHRITILPMNQASHHEPYRRGLGRTVHSIHNVVCEHGDTPIELIGGGAACNGGVER